MKTKHTKGEWEISHEINVMAKSGRPICACGTSYGSNSQDENKANAKLIASVPKLLKALSILINNGFQCPSNKDMDFAKKILKEAIY